MSDHADWPSLLRTAHETGARRVIATHGDTDALVRVLNTQGIDTGVFATGYGEDDYDESGDEDASFAEDEQL